MNLKEYRTGVRTGLPVGLGYFSVSFGFGAMAVSKGLGVAEATLISASNLTSAGQFAGLSVIVENSGLWLMILTQLIINSRYALMSLALSQRMGQKMVERMGQEFGSEPEDIVAVVGPSICQDCYEVSEDVIDEFRQHFEQKLWPELFYRKENGKYQLNLWKANEAVLTEAGIPKQQIAVTNVCTHCNPEILFSHRATGNKRGNLSAFLALKEE